LSAPEYFRQIFWSSAIDLPDDLEKLTGRGHARNRRLAGRRKGHPFPAVPQGTLIVFDPVTHAASLEVSGEETSERQNLSVIFTGSRFPSTPLPCAPDHLRLALTTALDVACSGGMGGEPALDDLLRRRKSVLTATRLLTNQTFRGYLPDRHARHRQRLKILA